MSLIKAVMERYFPEWEAPEEYGRTWIPTECPVHGDDTPSASVSYELDAFTCHACGYSGDYLRIIEREEDVSFGEAVTIAERIATESSVEVPRKTTGKPRRGVSKLPRFTP